jgi:predicted RNA binding protein YcfA (HicA-like mRNA interferase family)
MPKPISRREFIRRFHRPGWEGPFPRGKHMGMGHPDGRRVMVPNPHGSDLDWTLVKRILEQAGVSKDEWDALS